MNTTKKYPSRVIENSYGLALIATKDLPKGIIVEKFEGKIVKYNEVPEELKRYAIFIGDKKNDEWLISHTDAIRANHSCNPNCVIDDDLNIITKKKVKCGEELTYSYNHLEEDEKLEDFVWDEKWNFECQCGSENCQKKINKYVKS
jgi:SET domain-containing protein